MITEESMALSLDVLVREAAFKPEARVRAKAELLNLADRLLRRRHELSEDGRADFMLSVHQFLDRLIDSYHPGKGHFVNFFMFALMRRLRSFIRQSAIAQTQRLIAEREYAHENPCTLFFLDRLPPLLQDPAAAETWRRIFTRNEDGSVNRRRRFMLLCLALKHSRFLDPEDMERLGNLTMTPFPWLRDVCRKLTAMTAEREEKFHRLVQWRNVIFSRARLAEVNLLAEIEPETRQRLKKKLLRLQQATQSCSERIQHKRTLPSNRELAMVMGVAKSTVDSALLRLKKILGCAYLESEERYA